MYTRVSKIGQKKLRKTTQGWNLCIEWKDGSTTWEPLKELKESNPIEVSEYAIANKIDHAPAFAWWVPDTLHKRNRIIKAVKERALKRNYKYGIKVPRNVEEALEIDKETSLSSDWNSNACLTFSISFSMASRQNDVLVSLSISRASSTFLGTLIPYVRGTE